MAVALEDLEPIETAPSGGGEVTLDDLEELNAPNNSVYHAPSGRVLETPQTLDARSTQFVIDRDIDGKKGFMGQVNVGEQPPPLPPDMKIPELPKPSFFARSFAGWIAGLPRVKYGSDLETAQQLKEGKRIIGQNIQPSNLMAYDTFQAPPTDEEEQMSLEAGIALEESSRKLIERNRQYIKDAGFTTEDAETFGDKLSVFLGSGAPSIGVTIGMGLLTKNPIAAAGFFYAQQKGETYIEVDEARPDLSSSEKGMLASSVAIPSAALEYVGGDLLFKSMAASGLGKRIVKGALSESTTESLQYAQEESVLNASDVRDTTQGEFLENLALTALSSGILGGASSGAIGHGAAQEAQKAGVPEDQAIKFGQSVSAAYPLASQNLQEFIDKEVSPLAADDESAAQFVTLMQRFREGKPVTEEMTFTDAEQAVFDKWVNLFQQNLPDTQSVAAVEKRFFDIATTAGLDNEQAVASAKLIGARAEAASKALGVSPMEWYESHNLDIEVQRTREEALQDYQARLDELNKDLPGAIAPEEQGMKTEDGYITSYSTLDNGVNPLGQKETRVKRKMVNPDGDVEVTEQGDDGIWYRNGQMPENVSPLVYTSEADAQAAMDEDFSSMYPEESRLSNRAVSSEDEAIKAEEIAGYKQRLIDARGGTTDVSMKKPVLKYIKDLGGIHPDGLIAQELRHIGINSKTAPGLFRRREDALRDIDNIPTEEFNRALGTAAKDDGNGYVDRDWLLEALRDEQFGARLGQERPVGDDSFIQALDKAGLDYRTATAEQVYEALGADADIVATAAGMGIELNPREVRQIRGLMEQNPQLDVQDAIDEFAERSAIMGETLYQREGDQTVLLGAEKISDKQLAERKMQGRLKSGKAQKPMDEGLFGDEAKQQTLFQRLSIAAERAEAGLREALNALPVKMTAEKVNSLVERARNRALTDVDKSLLSANTVAGLYARQLGNIRMQEGARGAITFGKNRTLIQLFQDANPSTLLHELGHLFLRDMAKVSNASRRPMVKKDFDIIKQWLGSKDGKFTEEQEEKFARGFEAYLREGKAPVQGLQAIFDRFKQWLSSIYKSAKDLNVDINDDVRAAFDRMLGANYKQAEAAVQERDQAKIAQDYAQVALAPPSTLAQDSGDVLASAKALAGNIFTPVSSRLGRIDPKLKAAVRKYTFQTGLAEQRDRERALPFLNAIEKMEDADYRMLDFALKNRDTERADQLMKQYGMEKEFQEIRDLLDDIYNAATAAGLDVSYLDDYFPRMVQLGRSSDYLSALRGRPDWSLIQEAIQLEDPMNQWTDEEKAAFVNKWLRGHASAATYLTKPSFTKERVIDYVEPQYNHYYLESGEALLKYISAMRLGIAQREIFGKGKNAEESIGAYVLNLVNQGVIDHNQENEVKMLMQALVNSKGPSAFVSWTKNVGYIYLMGSPISAITQIGDLAFALAKNGYWRTGVSAVKAITGRSILTKEELGIDNIAQEFEDKTRASNAVRHVFRLTGLSFMDNVGKQTFIESSYKRLRAEAKKNSARWQDYMKNIFGEEFTAVRQDLLDGNLTDNVKLLLYSELSDMQPVSLAEMPVGYLRGGNLRAFYMLKTYTVKQIDVYRTQCFDKIASGNAEDVKEGVQMLVRLSFALMLTGMGADALKDLLLGRAMTLSETFIDNLWKLTGVTKYNIYQARDEGIGDTIIQMLFSFAAIAAPLKDIGNDVDEIVIGKTSKRTGETTRKPAKDSETLGKVPVVGKFYYWWYGGGRAKEERKAAKNAQ